MKGIKSPNYPSFYLNDKSILKALFVLIRYDLLEIRENYYDYDYREPNWYTEYLLKKKELAPLGKDFRTLTSLMWHPELIAGDSILENNFRVYNEDMQKLEASDFGNERALYDIPEYNLKSLNLEFQKLFYEKAYQVILNFLHDELNNRSYLSRILNNFLIQRLAYFLNTGTPPIQCTEKIFLMYPFNKIKKEFFEQTGIEWDIDFRIPAQFESWEISQNFYNSNDKITLSKKIDILNSKNRDIFRSLCIKYLFHDEKEN